MRRSGSRWLAIVVAGTLATSACSKLERLTIVRPTANRDSYTQVAPTYNISDNGRKSSAMTAAQLVASASAFYAAGQVPQARERALQALKRDPASGDAHTILALVASRAGDAAAAGQHYRKALDIAPDNGAYANNYGGWLCGNGRAQESLGWFDKALADPSYPTPVSALANAGACAQQAGQPARAEASWRKALALDPGLVQALSGLAGLDYARGDYMSARAFAERWLALAPQDADGLRLAAQIEHKLGDNAAARGYGLRLQALSPGAAIDPVQ